MNLAAHIVQHEIIGVGSGSGGATSQPVTVPNLSQFVVFLGSNTEALVDSFLKSSLSICQYVLYAQSGVLTASYELSLIKKQSQSLDYTIHSILGDKIDIDFTFELDPSNLLFKIKNNTDANILLKVIRYNLGNF